jgi:hypothetical protein
MSDETVRVLERGGHVKTAGKVAIGTLLMRIMLLLG